ncbi:hypothetical protein B5E60_12335 [Alistipes sp. An116]|nr:hypothetical protein B5E60_12335 [Alistipes sp. An116]
MVLLAVVCEVLGRAFFRAVGFSIAVRAAWLGVFRVEVVGSAAFYRGGRKSVFGRGRLGVDPSRLAKRILRPVAEVVFLDHEVEAWLTADYG